MKQKMKRFANKVLDLMYPKSIKCMFCAEELNHLEYNCTCENCMSTLPFIANPCSRCGSPMTVNQKGVCLKCKTRNFYFEEAKSIFEYRKDPLKVVHNLKYNNGLYLVEPMVKYLTDVYSTWNVFADVVTCVPMFETREKMRGYNQSKLLAKEFANKTKVPFVELCAKVVDTKSQTELNTKERIENVKDSFVVKKEYLEKIKGKTILIIDDVVTTGATTSEISKMLTEAGAQTCYVLTFAHTVLEQVQAED